MRSLRLDPDLDERIKRAAAVRGETPSEFLRRAAAERADATLAEVGTLAGWADVIGVVHSEGGRAERTGEAFTELLVERNRE